MDRRSDLATINQTQNIQSHTHRAPSRADARSSHIAAAGGGFFFLGPFSRTKRLPASSGESLSPTCHHAHHPACLIIRTHFLTKRNKNINLELRTQINWGGGSFKGRGSLIRSVVSVDSARISPRPLPSTHTRRRPSSLLSGATIDWSDIHLYYRLPQRHKSHRRVRAWC